MRNRAGDALAVECGQVFERSAAAGEDDEVDEIGSVEIGKRGFDFGGRGFALHGDGAEQNVQAGVAAADDVEKVADDGAGGRGDDADRARERGERLLAVGVEETFGFEALFQLLEGELQRAGADGLHGFRDKLQLAALLVDADAAANQDVQAIFGTEAEKHGLAAEEHDGELGLGVLEREVDVAGGRGAEVGNLAFDPDVAVFLLDQLADLGDEFADGPDAARWVRLIEAKPELRSRVEIGREWIVRDH